MVPQTEKGNGCMIKIWKREKIKFSFNCMVSSLNFHNFSHRAGFPDPTLSWASLLVQALASILRIIPHSIRASLSICHLQLHCPSPSKESRCLWRHVSMPWQPKSSPLDNRLVPNGKQYLQNEIHYIAFILEITHQKSEFCCGHLEWRSSHWSSSSSLQRYWIVLISVLWLFIIV